MLIGELSEKTGFSRDTIRFFEKQGLIQLDRKQRRDNNYKEYPEEVLNRLIAIKRIKQLGFTLKETAGLLDMMEENAATCNNVSNFILQKVELLEAKIRELTALRSQLLSSLQRCKQNEDLEVRQKNCPILTAD
ncbi:MAG TPA: MerR family DNA-binding protein [Anseongella sp.]